MAGEQFDKRWYILGGFAVLAVVIVGIILVSRSGGSSNKGGSTSATASAEKEKAASKKKPSEEGASAKGCTKVAQPKPREESLPKPKQTVKKGEKLTAVVETNCGTFDIALATTEAPVIANSFAYLAEEGFYNDLTFHRIVPEFVIQGGDPLGTGAGGAGYEVVEAPPKNLKYTIGTVAMAKTSTAPSGSAGSQFYIVTGPQGETLPPEYALAGKVSSGLAVVKRIGELGGPEEKPTQPVVIEKMSIERG
ncbi:MAG TPA: peptidylprolyl isomerase [Solirubrobacterales bacterium]|jgi:cyclophilin family peptidyl-prolyl cis-trans isomerase|nr:peptidylprolyl isomerase [Solirubrobacterales bacterium]